MFYGSYDGLYEEAGECNGQPYYKCTCCKDYSPEYVEHAESADCQDDPDCQDDADRCMSDQPGWERGLHHYIFYSSAEGAWQLRRYEDGLWDELYSCTFTKVGYQLADAGGDLSLAASTGTWELYDWWTSSWAPHAMTATCKADSSASAMSAEGFNEILAGERGWGLQTLALLALLVLLVLTLFCCYLRRGRRPQGRAARRPLPRARVVRHLAPARFSGPRTKHTRGSGPLRSPSFALALVSGGTKGRAAKIHKNKLT